MRVSSCSECSCGISANEKKIAIGSYPILSKRIRERIRLTEGQCSYQQRRPAVVGTPVQHLMAQRYRHSATEDSKESSDSLQCTDVHTIVDGVIGTAPWVLFAGDHHEAQVVDVGYRY
jgi:hypothetical protein